MNKRVTNFISYFFWYEMGLIKHGKSKVFIFNWNIFR